MADRYRNLAYLKQLVAECEKGNCSFPLTNEAIKALPPAHNVDVPEVFPDTWPWPYVNAMDRRLTYVEDNCCADGGVDSGLSTRVTNLETRVTTIERTLSSLSSCCSDIPAIRTEITNIRTEITRINELISDGFEVEVDLSAIEGRITALETTVSGHTTTLSNHNTRITALERAISDVGDVDLSDIESRLDGHDTAISGLTTRMSSAETRITALEDEDWAVVRVVSSTSDITNSSPDGIYVVTTSSRALENIEAARAAYRAQREAERANRERSSGESTTRARAYVKQIIY